MEVSPFEGVGLILGAARGTRELWLRGTFWPLPALRRRNRRWKPRRAPGRLLQELLGCSFCLSFNLGLWWALGLGLGLFGWGPGLCLAAWLTAGAGNVYLDNWDPLPPEEGEAEEGASDGAEGGAGPAGGG